jgi:transcriptional regulator with XRE-family HTH domain
MGQVVVTRLKLAVVASGLEQREIARRADVREGDMSRYVTGRVEPRAAVAARIAGALNTTVDQLWPSERQAAA